MADLRPEDADFLADSLCTINHPMLQTARAATANDLREWCKGGLFNGRPTTPLEQATDLVQEARATFGDWVKAGGTTAFRALFRKMFDPLPAPSNAFQQNLGPKPPECGRCGGSGYIGEKPHTQFCECGMGVYLSSDPGLGERWLAILNGHPLGGLRRNAPASQIQASDEAFREHQRRVAAEISEAELVLADESATSERKEIAREKIKIYRGEAKKKKAKGKMPWEI